MKIAMHEITTREGSFVEHLAAYQKTGWRHFEINLWHAGSFIEKEGIEKTAKAVRDHGLTCVAATGIGLNTFGDDAARAKDVDLIKKHGAVMQALGCSAIVTGSGKPEKLDASNYDAAMNALAKHVDAVAAAGTPFGVQLAIEVNWTSLCRSFSSAAKLMNKVLQPNVGVVWDPAHYISTPSRPEDLDLLNGRIIHAHLDDIRPCYFEVMDINGDRVAPGQGIIPLKALTCRIEANGYTGWHCLELFNKEVWAMPLEQLCRFSREQCLRVWPDAQF